MTSNKVPTGIKSPSWSLHSRCITCQGSEPVGTEIQRVTRASFRLLRLIDTAHARLTRRDRRRPPRTTQRDLIGAD